MLPPLARFHKIAQPDGPMLLGPTLLVASQTNSKNRQTEHPYHSIPGRENLYASLIIQKQGSVQTYAMRIMAMGP